MAVPTTRKPTPMPPLAAGRPSSIHSGVSATVDATLREAVAADRFPAQPSGFAPIAVFAHRPDNPRTAADYDPARNAKLAELIASSKELGILQPLVVCDVAQWCAHHPDDLFDPGVKLIVIIGNIRLEAARARKMVNVAYIRNNALAHPQAARKAALIENIHRQALPPVLEAREIAALAADSGCSNRELAAELAVSHTHINNRLALLRLIEPFADMVNTTELSVDKALPITRLPEAEQQKLHALGAPFKPSRLAERAPVVDDGKTLSAAVRIPKRSTPTDIAKVLREQIPPTVLDEVRRLLSDPDSADDD